MTTPTYVRSTDGNDADNGSTWALAFASLAGFAAVDSAGDTVYLSQAHSESTAASVNYNFAGTLAAPTKIIGANDGAAPPTAVSTAPAIAVTGGGNDLGLNSGSTYWYGINFTIGTAANSGAITFGAAGHISRFEACSFTALSNTAAVFKTGGGTSTKVVFESCTFKFATTAQLIQVNGNVKMRGGSVLSGSSANVVMFDFQTLGDLTVEGFDMSNCASSVDLCKTTAGTGITYRGRFIDCKLPSSWSGSPHNGTPNAGAVVELINCSAGAVNYAYWRKVYAGEIKHETTVVKTGGATDGTTTLSWKFVSNANAIAPLVGLESQELLVWNDTVGSPVTATVEVLTDNVTLKDDEAYIRLRYLGSSATPLATLLTDNKADPLATAANQTSSSVTWTTTGIGTPIKQKLSATFTPQMKGYVIAEIVLMKPSTTMYADPTLTLS